MFSSHLQKIAETVLSGNQQYQQKMDVAVTSAGSILFRNNYSINGRQVAITFGRYGVGGITLSEAGEQLGEAKKILSELAKT